MQQDGNLVIYKKYNDHKTHIWHTNTHVSPLKRPFHLIMQGDGNLVMYDMNQKHVWHTKTFGKGEPNYALKMQSDGNLVLYDKTGYHTWVSNSQQHLPHDV